MYTLKEKVLKVVKFNSSYFGVKLITVYVYKGVNMGVESLHALKVGH